MRMSDQEARDLRVFLHALPERARNDHRAVQIFAQLYSELHHLSPEHVIRRALAEPLS